MGPPPSPLRSPISTPVSLQAAQYAMQRLGHRGHLERDFEVRRAYGLLQFASYPDVLRIRAVIEQQIFAEVEWCLGAIKTHAARREFSATTRMPFLETADAFSNLFDRAG